MGASGVGKSSLIIKYTSDKFEPYHIVTINLEKSSKQISYENEIYTLNFFNTSGDPDYASDYTKELRIADIFLMCFDYGSKRSFNHMIKIINELKESQIKPSSSKIMIIGNKYELKKKEVLESEVEDYSKANGLPFVNVSVKTGINLRNVFDQIVKDYHKQN